MSTSKSNAPLEGRLASLWQDLCRLFALSKAHRKRLYGAVALSLMASSVSLAVPLGLRALIDAVFRDGNGALLNGLALGLLGLFVLQATVGFAGRYLLRCTGERIVADLRKRVYAHLHELGFEYFAEERTGDLTSRLTNDVSSVRRAVTDALASLLTSGLMLVGSVMLMVALNWRLSIFILAVVPVAAFVARYFGDKVRHLSRGVQDDLADVTAVAEETLSAIRVVKAFARAPYERKRYRQAVEELFETARHRAFVAVLMSSTVQFIFFAALVAIFWYGGTEVLAERLTAGDLVAFIFYALNVARSTGSASQLYAVFNKAAGASSRLFELLDTAPQVKEHPKAIELPLTEGGVKFKDVSFSYEAGTPVLKDISVEVRPGETVAFVGPSGAGKTTLLHLIPRFFDPSSGQVSIDGHDLRSLQLRSLREQVALVSQDVHLFGTTVMDNIRYGQINAEDNQVREAAQAANAHEFIVDLPEGYDTEVGERGTKLSGGQRQRLSIARALLKDANLLLLDEATSSLDSPSEVQVQEALQVLTHNRTTFVIAHHLSTVQDADRILVLEKGRIVEDGTHHELVDRNGFYREVADHQFYSRAVAEPA